MQPTTYDGPRHGDYVRYVDELLRTSPLYRSAAQGWMAQGPSDFTDVVATPGAQPQSVVERIREQVREQVRESADKARAAAQQTARPAAGQRPAGKAARKADRARPASEARHAPAAAGKKKSWFSPGQLIWIVIALVLAVVIPGIGPFILLLTIINALVKGFRNGLKSSR